MSNPIPKPTRGRIVLVTVADSTEREFEIPAIVTHVHSDLCISAVAFSAFGDAGTGPDGTKPMTSIVHGNGPNTWRWMEYQLGQAAKAEGVESVAMKRIEELAAIIERIGQIVHVNGVQDAESAVEFEGRLERLEAQLIALNQKQPASQRVAVNDPGLQLGGIAAGLPLAGGIAGMVPNPNAQFMADHNAKQNAPSDDVAMGTGSKTDAELRAEERNPPQTSEAEADGSPAV